MPVPWTNLESMRHDEYCAWNLMHHERPIDKHS